VNGAPLPLQARDVSCGHGGRPLLAGVTLELPAGGCLGLVGPNGSGKTTLLRTLGGQLPALGGQVLLGGAAVDTLDPRQRAHRVALLPQVDRADSGLLVRELVELGRTPHLGLWGHLGRRDRRAVQDALEACQLTNLAGRRLDQVSGGERQRARIAMTLAQQAPALLLDEPANHLDLRRRHELYELLRRLRRDRRLAVALVLHDLADAFRECHRVMVLDQGGVQALDPGDPARVPTLARAFDVPEDRIPL
jgi:iron complex transport system ATP-binding protein